MQAQGVDGEREPLADVHLAPWVERRDDARLGAGARLDGGVGGTHRRGAERGVYQLLGTEHLDEVDVDDDRCVAIAAERFGPHAHGDLLADVLGEAGQALCRGTGERERLPGHVDDDAALVGGDHPAEHHVHRR